MTELSIQSLFESGVQFGHKKNSLHPHMAPYVYLNSSSVSVIDLKYSMAFLKDSKAIISKVLKNNQSILFVSTRPQFTDIVKDAAVSAKSPFVTHKWLGGMLTNWSTISKSLNKMKKYQAIIDANTKSDNSKYTKKELLSLQRKMDKIELNLEGLKELKSEVGLMIVFDLRKERTAIKEAKRLGIPVLGIVDTNNDPSLVDYMVPGNDDSTNAIALYSSYFASLITEVSDTLKKDGEKRVIRNSSSFNKDVKKLASKHDMQ